MHTEYLTILLSQCILPDCDKISRRDDHYPKLITVCLYNRYTPASMVITCQDNALHYQGIHMCTCTDVNELNTDWVELT